MKVKPSEFLDEVDMGWQKMGGVEMKTDWIILPMKLQSNIWI